MRRLLSVTKALGDESRLRILAALGSGELCVCQIVALLELAPSTVSKHLALLRQAELVDSRKDGRWVHYRRAERGTPTVRRALELVDRALAADPAAERDARRLAELRALDPAVLCAPRPTGAPSASRPAAARAGSATP